MDGTPLVIACTQLMEHENNLFRNRDKLEDSDTQEFQDCNSNSSNNSDEDRRKSNRNDRRKTGNHGTHISSDCSNSSDWYNCLIGGKDDGNDGTLDEDKLENSNVVQNQTKEQKHCVNKNKAFNISDIDVDNRVRVFSSVKYLEDLRTNHYRKYIKHLMKKRTKLETVVYGHNNLVKIKKEVEPLAKTRKIMTEAVFKIVATLMHKKYAMYPITKVGRTYY